MPSDLIQLLLDTFHLLIPSAYLSDPIILFVDDLICVGVSLWLMWVFFLLPARIIKSAFHSPFDDFRL